MVTMVTMYDQLLAEQITSGWVACAGEVEPFERTPDEYEELIVHQSSPMSAGVRTS
jgi:hypothetical protein